MKISGFIAFICLLFVSQACAFEPLNFEWICNTDDPAGYRIHWSNAAGEPYEAAIDVGLPVPDENNKCHFTLNDPPPRLNFYVATVYDVDGFPSDWSNEIQVRSKHSAVKNFEEVK